MSKDEKDLPGAETDRGGENVPPEEREGVHDRAGADSQKKEPLGPVTPDDETDLGDSPDLHDEITPHDLPKGHPGRREAERLAAESPDGTTKGNV